MLTILWSLLSSKWSWNDYFRSLSREFLWPPPAGFIMVCCWSQKKLCLFYNRPKIFTSGLIYISALYIIIIYNSKAFCLKVMLSQFTSILRWSFSIPLLCRWLYIYCYRLGGEKRDAVKGGAFFRLSVYLNLSSIAGLGTSINVDFCPLIFDLIKFYHFYIRF